MKMLRWMCKNKRKDKIWFIFKLRKQRRTQFPLFFDWPTIFFSFPFSFLFLFFFFSHLRFFSSHKLSSSFLFYFIYVHVFVCHDTVNKYRDREQGQMTCWVLEYNGDVSQGSKEHRFGPSCNFCPLVFPSGRQEISLSFGLAT